MAETQSTFTVSGYDSERDVERAVDELEETNGVMEATVGAESGAIEVRIDEDLISQERVKREIRDGGLEVE